MPCAVVIFALSLAGCDSTFTPHLLLFNEAEVSTKDEDAVFQGYVVDDKTRQAVANAHVRLELIYIS